MNQEKLKMELKQCSNEFDVLKIVSKLNSKEIKKLLFDTNIIEEFNISSFYFKEIFNLLNQIDKEDFLQNKTLTIQKYKFVEYDIANLIANLNSDEVKFKMIDYYEIKDDSSRYKIYKTLSENKIREIVENEKYELKPYIVEWLAAELTTDTLIDVLKENKQKLKSRNIKPYRIMETLSKEKQKELIYRIDETGLDIDEKRRMLVKAKEEVKKSIKKKKLPKEYKSALNLREDENILSPEAKVRVNLKDDLETYRGLDELIYINGLELSDEDKKALIQLGNICPNVKIVGSIISSYSTLDEYIKGEEWIDSVINGIDENWTDIQKVAYIDNRIGKRIDYSPDWNTEIFDENDSRALWKIICTGKGVCNGIAQIEKYIFDKIGIESERVSSNKHSFIKLKNITVPTENGYYTGNTLLDPTWNMSDHRYGAYPNVFCKSYEEIRKLDIKQNGTDTESHKNDIELKDATLNLNEKHLREIFTSIGIADKDGNFPIKTLVDKIQNCEVVGKQGINKRFEMLKEYYPDFAKYNHATADILSGLVLRINNIDTNKCIVNRVYEKEDKTKTPILYVYADLEKDGKEFYYVDKEKGEFIQLAQEEFEKRFECYEYDMEENKYQRPWQENIREIPKLENQKKNIEEER